MEAAKDGPVGRVMKLPWAITWSDDFPEDFRAIAAEYSNTMYGKKKTAWDGEKYYDVGEFELDVMLEAICGNGWKLVKD